MKRIIAPSILSANFLKLGNDIEMLNHSEAEWIHFDVMDGVFVPNISFGLPILEQVRTITTKPLDVHLMIKNPDPFIVPFKNAGADNITVHYETCTHLHRTIHFIKEQGIMASVCLNPHTPVELLSEILPDVDMVLIMSVNPGYGGQKFIESSYQKVQKLRNIIDKKNLNTLIEVDGGVNFETGKKLFEAGANVLVTGSFIFKSEQPLETIKHLLHE
ncbi:MAG: ribulose-phosphate 3-epimerase [Prolixibacteraceae bacterium]|nr:ribulose-phosphate 3-epimerase [Prolixibacteraceae bacterium]MBN2650028.1 ribulose-phosphate 3-epimerase [Prolixibacteraceae bacterium]